MASLQDTLFQELARAGFDARRAFTALSGIGERRRQLLLLLHEHEELSHADLQRRLDVDGAAVTRLVKQLESEGLVRRRLDPSDNRFTLASLTKSGSRVAADLHDARRRLQRRMLSGVNRDEQKTVMRVLDQVRRNLEAILESADGDTPKPRRS